MFVPLWKPETTSTTPLHEAVCHNLEETEKAPSSTNFCSKTAKLGQVSNHNQNSKGKQILTKQ